jgi:hypothetical protein
VYKPIRSSLRAIYSEFRRASVAFPGLCHEQVFDLVRDSGCGDPKGFRAPERCVGECPTLVEDASFGAKTRK